MIFEKLKDIVLYLSLVKNVIFLKFRLFILLFTLPLLIFGNTASVVLNTAESAIERACCAEESSDDCCCDHSEKKSSDSSEKTPCQDGECTSNGCFFSVQHNFFSENTSDFSLLPLDFLGEKISTFINVSLSNASCAIWIPPKIHS